MILVENKPVAINAFNRLADGTAVQAQLAEVQ
jgi:hypothetical protein